jgi:hypothetical protein
MISIRKVQEGHDKTIHGNAKVNNSKYDAGLATERF